MNSTLLLKSALAGALALSAASVALAADESHAKSGKMEHMEKCYGINAAHKNDCQAPGHSCAGQDAMARDPNSFVAVPKGVCEKIEGGKLKPEKG